jgi:hypothetical protein
LDSKVNLNLNINSVLQEADSFRGVAEAIMFEFRCEVEVPLKGGAGLRSIAVQFNPYGTNF